MKTLHGAVVAAVIGSLSFLDAGHVQAASYVWSYFGRTYDTIVDDTPPDGTYIPGTGVSGSFVLASPLPGNLVNQNIIGSANYFYWVDGRNLLEPSNVNTSISNISVSTTPLGDIYAWNINLIAIQPNITSFPPGPPGPPGGPGLNYEPFVGQQTFQILTIFEGGSFIERGSTSECVAIGVAGCEATKVDYGESSRLVGYWALQFYPDPPLVTTPLPAALPLFATGLGALGLLGWRRKRKDVAATPDYVSP